MTYFIICKINHYIHTLASYALILSTVLEYIYEITTAERLDPPRGTGILHDMSCLVGLP